MWCLGLHTRAQHQPHSSQRIAASAAHPAWCFSVQGWDAALILASCLRVFNQEVRSKGATCSEQTCQLPWDAGSSSTCGSGRWHITVSACGSAAAADRAVKEGWRQRAAMGRFTVLCAALLVGVAVS